MDAESTMNNKKHQKHDEGEGKGTSWICDLPDPLVQEILSNLPTKEAIRTSILSKRWLDQWKDMSKLELDEVEREKREQFIDFVGKLLVVFNMSNLKKFSLRYVVDKDATLVNEWLNGFIHPHLEELSLNLDEVEQPLVLPEPLFTSPTLTKFEVTLQHIIVLPPSIYFPCLKSLTLKYVVFPNTCSTQQFFSSCQSLEELTLIDCNWTKVKSISIACPLLKRLIIREWTDDSTADEFNDDQDDPPRQCQLLIVGSQNLTSFSYNGDLINDYFLYFSDSVVNAVVEVHPPEYTSSWDAGYFVYKLLRALSNAEFLSITDSVPEALRYSSFLMANLPMFYNLDTLRLESGGPINLSCLGIITILHNSPILEVVEFSMGVYLPENGEDKMDPLPQCFGTHLNTIEIYGFTGSEGEMNAIKFLLQATPALESICVYSSKYTFNSDKESKRRDMLFEQIESFPRASMDCELDLE